MKIGRIPLWPMVAALITVPVLANCALLGRSEPVTLFQFGDADDSSLEPASSAQQQRVVIIYAGSTFNRQSSGDRILTSTGNQAAYIAGARWAAPAQELFDTMAVRDIEARSPHISVVRAGAPSKAQFVLAVDVRRFEVLYSADPKAASEVAVDTQAKLMRIADRTIVGDWPIRLRRPVPENKVSAIVAAFDRIASEASDQIAINVATAAGAH